MFIIHAILDVYAVIISVYTLAVQIQDKLGGLVMLFLQKARIDRGFTKAELSRRTRIQPGIIGWIEEGRFKPYDNQLMKLAAGLGWQDDPADLMNEYRNEQSNS
jgi:ribosome-binding protein aMBF1 (putative translation factor)